MNHTCKTIERCESVCIKYIDRRWYWCFTNNPNTSKEKTDAHEIKYCPYCGIELVAEG